MASALMNKTLHSSDEAGNMLLTKRKGLDKTFLWPPVYRTPFFPVFFYSGDRKYKRQSSRCCKDQSRQIGTTGRIRQEASQEVMDPLRLARIIQGLGDEIRDSPLFTYKASFRNAHQKRDYLHLPYEIKSIGIHSPSAFHTFSYLVVSSKIIVTSFARRLLRCVCRLNIFPRKQKHRSDHNVLEEMDQNSAESTLPDPSDLQKSSDSGRSRRASSCLPRSHSVSSLSQQTSAKTFRRAKSLPDRLLKASLEEFTPDITADENDESYRFQCSCPGLYQCRVTGLLFHMDGGGDVVYRVVPWNRRLLAHYHKQPAGPLFDIKCVQQSVRQLHLPHCEIRSTGGAESLSVAHVNDEGVEFIPPHAITETHVIINITGFSGFGNVKDEDAAPDPVRALVLLFYRPPADPDPTSLLNVLLLPRNVVLRDVLRTRKKLVGDEIYIETSPHCKLQPQQEYTLSTCPGDDSVLVQPTEAEFDCDNYDNYFPSFQVNWEETMNHLKLFLRDTHSSQSVWERRVCLSSTGAKRSCRQGSSKEVLLDIRSSFVEGISGPVLKSLLDKLFEKKVMTDSERESADEMQNKRDKARFLLDTVRRKGEAAGSEMIELLREVDPFLCEHLGLI